MFATGSQPIRPAIPGMELPGVITFRDINDIWTIWHRAGAGDRAVVIGGGLLGLEAAYGLVKAGARVTVLHLMDRLMERQLDAGARRMLRRAVEAMGIEVILNADTSEFPGGIASKASYLRTAAPSTRMPSSWRSASGRAPSWRAMPVSASSAAS